MDCPASVLLQYPTPAVFEGLDRLDAEAAAVSPRESRAGFERFLDWLRGTTPTEVAQHYVETFDLRRRCALHPSKHLTCSRIAPAARRPGPSRPGSA